VRACIDFSDLCGKAFYFIFVDIEWSMLMGHINFTGIAPALSRNNVFIG
jgi:hypothetical protein